MQVLQLMPTKQLCHHFSRNPTTNPEAGNFPTASVPFPINLLRNIGRISASDSFYYHLVLDLDVLPSVGLFDNLQTVISQYDDLKDAALIIPVFEIDSHSQPNLGNIPRNKASLFAALETDQVRPFYWEINANVQAATQFARWKSMAHELDVVDIAYEVDWALPFEPFILVHKTAPLYDTR